MKRLFDYGADNTDKPGLLFCCLYFAVLLFYCIALTAQLPIHAPDTDLWYHLTGGRLFWTTGQLANDATYSFLDPLRRGVDYYWGFQALVYALFERWGYTGLVVLRTILFAITIGATMFYCLLYAPRQHPFMLIAIWGGWLPVIMSGRFMRSSFCF
jgi:hypothetical protein